MDAVASEFHEMQDSERIGHAGSSSPDGEDDPEPRILKLYGEPPEGAADNSIRTSKYRWWSLVPINLLEQ